jgi:hypothetical protein
MLTPEEISMLSATSARALYRRVEEGKLHFIETEGGLLFVCLASLQEFSVTASWEERNY